MKKTCFVTGASGDIGQAVAKKLALNGYRLILHYHKNEKAIRQLEEELPATCVREVFSADLSSGAEINQLLSVLDPEVDAVVFAHGGSLIGLFQEAAETEMDDMLASHVKAPWLISRHLIPSMIRRKTGHIVLISSIWGDAGASCEVIYSSVKGAQNSFVKALGKELAPSGIAVNGVLPGFVDTKMNECFSLEERKALYEEIPAGRGASPEEVARVAAFLASPEVTYVNGELIRVTGGW